MQEADKRQTGDAQEKLLTEVLNACMEEQLSFIPPERDIARMHTFSEEFQEYMRHLLRTKGKPGHKTIAKHEFVFRFNKIAASLLILFVVGGLCAGAFLLFSPKGATESAEAPAAMEDAAESSAATTEAAPEETVAEESASEEAFEEELESGAGYAQEVSFMGGIIHLAAAQNLPEETEYVKTLVSSPLVDREAESVKVTIGNLNEYPIYYYKVMDLEVWIDGAWYLVPSKQELTEEEQQYMVMLEEGMAQDEELLLEYYDLDYEAEKYRVVTYLDGLILSSEFRFENLEEDLEAVLDRAEE